MIQMAPKSASVFDQKTLVVPERKKAMFINSARARKKKATAAGFNCFSNPSLAFLKYHRPISSRKTAERGVSE